MQLKDHFVTSASAVVALVIIILFGLMTGLVRPAVGDPPKYRKAPCLVKQKEFKSYVKRVYERKTITKKAVKAMDRRRACAASVKANKNMLKYQRAQSAKRKERLVYHDLTPFPGPHGTRWAIPYAVVACEGGWNGWSTFNHGGSGAAGPYQLLGHGAPMPANTWARKMAHHRIARNLYLASGLGPWISSQPCWG